MTDALKDRGWFWWGDVEVPPKQFAPEGSVVGTLTISDTGRIEIELDGVMPSDQGPLATFSQGALPPDRAIEGLLKSEGKYILASNLHRYGGSWSSTGISHERFIAQTCLVSAKMLPRSPKVRVVSVDLGGFEEWLRFGRLRTTITRRSLVVRYNAEPDIRYSGGEFGRLTVTRNLTTRTHGAYGSRGVDLRSAASLRYRPSKSLDLSTAIQTYGLIQDLLILLTGSEHPVDWPTFALTAKEQFCKAYFFRTRPEAKPPAYHECITAFVEIKDRFGDIFFKWLSKRSELGPGFYLYLSTRRGMNTYEEQKFSNLVSGLEALHRSLTGDPVSQEFQEKMDRILGSISDVSDRNWLRRRTRGFGAPGLEQRLIEILNQVPLAGIKPAKLGAFAAACARTRNVFAHGDHLESAVPTASIQQLAARNSVLSYLYHARILLEIGMPLEIVDRWLNHSPESYRINWFMVQAGLKSADVLRPRKAADLL